MIIIYILIKSLHKGGYKLKNNEIKSKHKIRNNIMCLFLYIFSVSIFCITYYVCHKSPSSLYEKSIKSYITNVNSINKKAALYSNNKTIYTEKIKQDFPNIIKNLSNQEKNIQALSPDSKYKEAQDNFLLGIKYNINIYSQILGIANNPNGTDLDKSLKNLCQYKTNCINCYSKVNIKSSSPSLTQETIKFIDSITFYTGQVVKNNVVTISQDNEYNAEIEDLNTRIHELIDYHYRYVKNARQGRCTYDDVLANINSNTENLNLIKSDFLKLSVPEAHIQENILFKNLIDDLSAYLNEINKAVKSEKLMSSSGKINKKKADKLYKKASELFKKSSDDYADYSSKIAGFEETK